MTNKKIVVIPEFEFKQDKIEEGKAVLESLIEPSKQDEGSLGYELYQDPDNPCHFILVEFWASYDLWQAHANQPYIPEAGEKLEPLLAKPFIVRWFKACNSYV